MPKTSEFPKKPGASDFNFDFSENSALIDWLVRYGKNIVYALVCLLLAIFILLRFSASHTLKMEKEYLQASKEFSLFTQDSSEKGDLALSHLNSLLKSHSELRSIYDGEIAQLLLNKNRGGEASNFAHSIFSRTQGLLTPLHVEFSEISLLIGAKSFEKALDAAQLLKQKMLETFNTAHAETLSSDLNSLFALNLLRIGMLQEQLGRKNDEYLTWQEWKGYAGLRKISNLHPQIDRQAFLSLIQTLNMGNLSILDYMTSRELSLETSRQKTS